MAIYRLSVKTLSRSDNKNVIAAAAYRAGQKLIDVCDFFTKKPKTHNYSYRSGIVTSGIVVPAHAPTEFRNRARLWNIAERGERRKDSQVAREVLIALPHELTDEQREKLVRTFAQNHIVGRYGAGVDFSIHRPDKQGDQRNDHAHILMTTRSITKNGFHPKVIDELNNKAQSAQEIDIMRKAWEISCNEALRDAEIASRIDCRSLKDQGIERVPEPKQGVIATQMERDGRTSHAGEERRAVKFFNDALVTVTNCDKRWHVEEAEDAILNARKENRGFTHWLCKRALSFFKLGKGNKAKKAWQYKRARELFHKHWTKQHRQSNQNYAQAPPTLYDFDL